jgi:hypothetical protein
MVPVLIVVLVLMLLSALPSGPQRQRWSYAPSGVITIAVVILLVMMLTGHL